VHAAKAAPSKRHEKPPPRWVLVKTKVAEELPLGDGGPEEIAVSGGTVSMVHL
jgi:hypothetical protein